MSSNTILILLVILNLLAIHYAYRIGTPNDEPLQALVHKYEESANDDESLTDLYNKKRAEEYNSDNYYLIPCHSTSSSSYILCKKLDHLYRRDTGFLRFGRRR